MISKRGIRLSGEFGELYCVGVVSLSPKYLVRRSFIAAIQSTPLLLLPGGSAPFSILAGVTGKTEGIGCFSPPLNKYIPRIERFEDSSASRKARPSARAPLRTPTDVADRPLACSCLIAYWNPSLPP